MRGGGEGQPVVVERFDRVDRRRAELVESLPVGARRGRSSRRLVKLQTFCDSGSLSRMQPWERSELCRGASRGGSAWRWTGSRDAVEADPHGANRTKFASQPGHCRGVALDPGGAAAEGDGAVAALAQLGRQVDHAALGDDPAPRPAVQTQFWAWLITIRRPLPDLLGTGRRSRRLALSEVMRLRASWSAAALLHRVPGLEADHAQRVHRPTSPSSVRRCSRGR